MSLILHCNFLTYYIHVGLAYFYYSHVGSVLNSTNPTYFMGRWRSWLSHLSHKFAHRRSSVRARVGSLFFSTLAITAATEYLNTDS
jgi:hypothetical protein